ncbi:HAD family hydrolase [Catenulispora yoronensis]
MAPHRGQVRAELLPAQTIILGDTVRDVEAALTHGAAVVAVASGTTPAADLRAAGAEIVLDDLADTGAVLAAIRDASEIAARVASEIATEVRSEVSRVRE